ncbi:MAG: DUF4350 domain-containing protein [Candidatus Krumholzibacteriia bacterium]
MRAAAAIMRREIGAFFHGPMGPVVLGGFLVAVGLFFTNYLFGYSELSMTALQTPRSGNYLNLAEGIFRPLVSVTAFFLMFLVPAITMRTFAPEFQSGRFDLMASWPVTDGTWIAAKWAASLAIGAVMVLCSLAYFAVVWFLGSPEPGPAFTAILGEVLLIAALAGWGVLASALFAHQMVAYFLAFVVSLMFFLVGSVERYAPGPAGRIAGELSILEHFESFTLGVLDLQDVLYFVLMAAAPLTAAAAVLAGRRLPRRRGLPVWAPPTLVLALCVVVYLLGLQFPWSRDLTGNRRYSLAPQTVKVLESLGDGLDVLESAAPGTGTAAEEDGVMVYAFYQPLDPAWDTTEGLLTSCARTSRHFRFRMVDPESDLDLVREFDVTVTRTVIVSAGGRWVSLLQPEESALINAVYRLVTGERSQVRQLQGHGEHQLESDERPGYSSYGQLMQEQGYDVRPLFLAENPVVPRDCDVLVIAGPRTQPATGELDAVTDFLRRGGAVLALLDPPTPSEWGAWLEQWRVGLTDAVIIAADRAEQQYGVSARTIVVSDGYGDHEITRPLQGIASVFPLVQPLTLVGEPDSTITGAILLQSGDLTWAEFDPVTRFTGRPTFDRASDIQGPLPFGMVLELYLAGMDAPPGRVVVLGNSEFASNANLNLAANRDLLLNMLAWLAREEELMEVRGRDPLSQPVVLGDDERKVLGWGAALGWPLLVGSLFLGVMWRHRRQTGSGA